MAENKPIVRVQFFSMNAVDLTQVLEDAPPGAWIALSSDQKIVGTGSTPEEALAAAKANGKSMPFLMKVPPKSALIL